MIYEELLNQPIKSWRKKWYVHKVGLRNQYRPDLDRLVKVPVLHKLDNPVYDTVTQTITIPDITHYKTVDDYYHDLFHEASHSLRGPNPVVGGYYMLIEEAVAEYSAVKLTKQFNLKYDLSNSASYVFETAPPPFFDHRSLEAQANKRAREILERQPEEAPLQGRESSGI